LPLIGIIGKPNAGKSTFFSALTKINVKIAPYPFTTIEPNKGIAYVRAKCVCKEFNVKDNPKNSICINGIRYIPIEVIDVAGLVPDAWKGRGLGNKFLDEIRRADALIHIIDASGSTDEEGRNVEMGTYDPIKDQEFIYKEIFMWIFNNLSEEIKKEIKRLELVDISENINFLERKLSGYSVRRKQIMEILNETGLINKKISKWKEEELKLFVDLLVKKTKPMVIVANKIDLPTSHKNYERIKEKFKEYYVIPASAEAELALIRANENGIIEYLPGSPYFKIISSNITEKQRKALEFIEKNILKKYGSTGVIDALEISCFKVLKYITVFPVEDQNKLTDHHGNVLPDAFLVPHGTTAREFAYMIHTELGKNFIYAIDVRKKQKLGEDYILQDRDVIKIVAGS